MVNLKDVMSNEYNDFIEEYLKKEKNFSIFQWLHTVMCFGSAAVFVVIGALITSFFNDFVNAHKWIIFLFLLVCVSAPFVLSVILTKIELKIVKNIYEWEKDKGFFVMYNPRFFHDYETLPINFENVVVKDDRYFKFQILKSDKCYFCKTFLDENTYQTYNEMFREFRRKDKKFDFEDAVYVFKNDQISGLLNPAYEVYESRR